MGVYIEINIYIYCYLVESFHPIQELLIYKNMTLMSLRSRSHVKASMVLTRFDHYTQLYKITSKYYFKTYFNGADEARTQVL